MKNNDQPQVRFFVGDNVLIVLLGLFSLMILVLANEYSIEARRFPQLVAGLTLALCVYQTVLKFRVFALLKKQEAEKGKVDKELLVENEKVAPEKEINSLNWLFVLGVTILYFLLLKPVGFILTTFGVMTAIPIFLKYENKVLTVVLAIVITLVFYWIFTKIFYVPLPQGILGF